MPDSIVARRKDLNAWRPYEVIEEQEPSADGPVDVVTIFLTASECPVGCSMCDLWQNTLPDATPPGAIPTQIDAGLSGRKRASWIKLYNSGNFFDPRSIPVTDHAAIADRCQAFERVVVENHPRFRRTRVKAFRSMLAGKLEIAVGLETVQPRWLERMNKQMTRDDFDRYASWLKSIDVGLRVFLIVGVPGASLAESLKWSETSTIHAALCGARHVSLIPARSGHGWNGQSQRLPIVTAESLAVLQAKLIRRLANRCCVTVDTWDLRDETGTQPRAAIETQNLTQSVVWD